MAQRLLAAMLTLIIGTLAVQSVSGPLTAALLSGMSGVAALLTARAMAISVVLHSREQYELDNAAAIYHRRYVCPARDFDAQAKAAWHAAVAAADQIERSDVVRRQLVDSVRVTTMLPYLLWDIAERLARLSALRAALTTVLDGVQADDPEVMTLAAPQRQAHALAAEDVARRIRYLEIFAGRVAEADTARRREDAVHRLAGLNDSTRELLARTGNGRGAADGGEADLLALSRTDEVQSIIDQANDAVRKAGGS